MIDQAKIEQVARLLLEAIGEDVERPGLKDTPARYARFWKEFIEYEDHNLDTTFSAIETDQMIIVSGIEAWSLCEHHLLPFHCRVAIGYIAEKKIIGLSKLARITKLRAHRLQVQERLTHQIADDVSEYTKSTSVAVLVRGKHLCVAMRGVRDTNSLMTTSVMRGVFMDKPEARQEFLSLVNIPQPPAF